MTSVLIWRQRAMAKRTPLGVIQISVFLVTGIMVGLSNAGADMDLTVPIFMVADSTYVLFCTSLGDKVQFSWQLEDVDSPMPFKPNVSKCEEVKPNTSVYSCLSSLPFIARSTHANKTIKCTVKTSNGLEWFEVKRFLIQVNGGWSEWSYIRGCDHHSSHTCGTQSVPVTKIRECTNPSPGNGGLYCKGDTNEAHFEDCTKSPCPVDGYWSEWAQLRSLCSGTCGSEFELVIRTRDCNNPAPKHGGHDCVGNGTIETYYHNCTRPPCPSGARMGTLVNKTEGFPLQDVFLAVGVVVYILVVIGIAAVLIIRQHRLRGSEFRVHSDPTIVAEIETPQNID